MQTTDMLMRASMRGAQVAGSTTINDALRTLMWRNIPKPDALAGPLGTMVEPIIVPTALHLVATRFGEHVPQSDKVIVVCERALEGVTAQHFEGLFKLASPMFSGIAALANGADPAAVLAQAGNGADALALEREKTKRVELELELARLRANQPTSVPAATPQTSPDL